MNITALTATEEWQAGWKVVLACFVGFLFFSMMTQTLGVFMDPLIAEFGWSRAVVSSGLAIASLSVAILSPFFGILIDRYGPRRLALPGIVVASAAISLFSLANGSEAQWVALWAFYALISITVKTTVWMAAIVSMFDRAQGLALGVTLAGMSAAQIVMPPLATWLIDEFGWRMAYVCLGCGWGAVTFVLCFFFLHDAHSRRAAVPKSVDNPPAPSLTGLTIAEAWRDTALWRIGISSMITMLITTGLLIHQISILTEAGITRTNAAWLASLAGIAALAGKLTSGWLIDRFPANWVGGITLTAGAISFLLLMDGIHTPVLIVLAMAVSGYTTGSKLQIASYLTSRYGGLKNFGVIYGLMTSLIAVGSGLGPMLAGYTYDVSGNYTVFLIAGAIGSVLCGAILVSLPRTPEWGPDDEELVPIRPPA